MSQLGEDLMMFGIMAYLALVFIGLPALVIAAAGRILGAW